MKNTMTGNRALLKIGGQIVGMGVQSVDTQTDFGLQDVDGLGSPFTHEHVPGKVVYTINLSSYFISGKNLEVMGIVPDADTLLSAGTLEIEIIDNLTNQTQHLYEGCKAASHSHSYNKHVISGENATFRALRKIK